MSELHSSLARTSLIRFRDINSYIFSNCISTELVDLEKLQTDVTQTLFRNTWLADNSCRTRAPPRHREVYRPRSLGLRHGPSPATKRKTKRYPFMVSCAARRMTSRTTGCSSHAILINQISNPKKIFNCVLTIPHLLPSYATSSPTTSAPVQRDFSFDLDVELPPKRERKFIKIKCRPFKFIRLRDVWFFRHS